MELYPGKGGIEGDDADDENRLMMLLESKLNNKS